MKTEQTKIRVWFTDNTIKQIVIDRIVRYPRCTSINLAVHKRLTKTGKFVHKRDWVVTELATGRRINNLNEDILNTTPETALAYAIGVFDKVSIEQIFDVISRCKLPTI